jgi:predicted lipoprotein
MQRLGKPRILGAVVLVALLVAMALNTKFVTPKELASIGPESFDAKTTAVSLFKKARTEFEAKSAPLPEVVTAIQTDPKTAGEKYDAASPSEGTRIFAVTATGKVTDATRDALTLKVPGVTGETQVLVPLTTAINGTVLRDALGFKFADAPGQSDYQFVGDELKKLMQAEVTKGLGGDPAAIKGKEITVLGVISVVGNDPQPKAKPVNIQPVSVEVGS